MRSLLRSDGIAVVCVPNVAHWYPRFRSLLGAFDYDQRGILDRPTCASSPVGAFAASLEREGFKVRRLEPVGLPLDALEIEGTGGDGCGPSITLFLTIWPTMFAYQFILELTPDTSDRR